jgi:hypothetical protein
MDQSRPIEPFGFFTLDSLKAGWFMTWRIGVRVLAVMAVAGGAALLVGLAGGVAAALSALILSIGGLVAAIWANVLIPRLASRWAELRYGHPLTGEIRVWWGIVWRIFVVSLVAAVVFTPPNMVAISLQTAFKGSALGLLGSLAVMLLSLANLGVSILANGWAMSRVALKQLVGAVLPVEPVVRPPMVASPVDVASVEPHAMPAEPVASAPRAVAARPAAPAAPGPADAQGKRQCPKCGLYETERGSVIGWYCRVCGWRESRR